MSQHNADLVIFITLILQYTSIEIGMFYSIMISVVFLLSVPLRSDVVLVLRSISVSMPPSKPHPAAIHNGTK